MVVAAVVAATAAVAHGDGTRRVAVAVADARYPRVLQLPIIAFLYMAIAFLYMAIAY